MKYLQDNNENQPCYFVFDILLYNGTVLSNLPLKQRLGYLENLFTPIEGRLQYSARKTGQTKYDFFKTVYEIQMILI